MPCVRHTPALTAIFQVNLGCQN